MTEQLKLSNFGKIECERSAVYLIELQIKNLLSYKCIALSFKDTFFANHSLNFTTCLRQESL